MKKLINLQAILVIIIVLVGTGIRLYDIKEPPLDFHPMRQLRSALIARGVFYQLNPAFDPEIRQKALDLANLEIYEPPIFENIVGATYALIGSEQLWLARLYLALFWALGGIFLFLLARRLTSFYAALAGILFYFFLPFGVIASRSFQPEPWLTMWIILTAYALFRWSETPTWKWTLIAGLLGGIAVLVKIIAALFVGGMLLGIVFVQPGIKRLFRSLKIWIIGGLALLPTLLYYLIFQQQRSADFMSFWFGSLSYLVFTTNFYADWLAMLKGLVGLGFFVAALLGVILSKSPLKPILLGLWLGYGLYGLVFPYQYTTHEYYHLPIVAIIALSLPGICEAIFLNLSRQHWIWRTAAGVILICSAGYGFWVARSNMVVSNYEYEPASWKNVGEAIPEHSRFISLTADGGIRLRYYGWKSPTAVWPSSSDLRLATLSHSQGINDFEDYFSNVTRGMDYFLVTALSEMDAQPDLKTKLTTQYPVFFEGSGFIIYDLKNPIPQ